MKGKKFHILYIAGFFALVFLSLIPLKGSPLQLEKVKASLIQFEQYEKDIEQFKSEIESLSKRLIDILNSQGKNDLAQEIEELKSELISRHESDREQYEQTFEMLMNEVDTEIDRLDLQILLIQQKITMDLEFRERIKKLAEEKAKGVDLGARGELLVLEAGYKLMNMELKMGAYKTKIDETVQLYKKIAPESEIPMYMPEQVTSPVKESTPQQKNVDPPQQKVTRSPKNKTTGSEKQSIPQANAPMKGVVHYKGLAVDMWDDEHLVVRVNDRFRGNGTVHTILESSASLALDTKNGTCTGNLRYVYRVVYDDPNYKPEVTTFDRELRGTFSAAKYLRGPLNGVWLISSPRDMASMDQTSGLVFKSSGVAVHGIPELQGDFILLYLTQRSTPLANQKFFQQLQETGDLSPNYNREQPVAVLWLESQR